MATQEAWMWCNKCQGLGFAQGQSLGACAGGGLHDHNGSGNYILTADDPSATGQDNWRWCNKCEALAFAGTPETGQCPAGGMHDHTGSGNYVLSQDSRVGQPGWQWCRKCQMLSFTKSASLGACPAGGLHDHAGSGEYFLPSHDGSITYQWALKPFSAGKVDFTGGTLLVRGNGFWQFFGSLHDNSTWYGDNWALGFVFADTAHGAVASGNLGAKLSGGAVNGSFNLSGTDAWVAENYQKIVTSVVHTHLHVSGDPSGLISAVIGDLAKYGPQAVTLLASL